MSIVEELSRNILKKDSAINLDKKKVIEERIKRANKIRILTEYPEYEAFEDLMRAIEYNTKMILMKESTKGHDLEVARDVLRVVEWLIGKPRKIVSDLESDYKELDFINKNPQKSGKFDDRERHEYNSNNS